VHLRYETVEQDQVRPLSAAMSSCSYRGHVSDRGEEIAKLVRLHEREDARLLVGEVELDVPGRQHDGQIATIGAEQRNEIEAAAVGERREPMARVDRGELRTRS
jgi:hypothetical protein